MDRIRVLIADMPTMLIEIVTRLIDEQGDMDTLSMANCTLNDDQELAKDIANWQPDVVLLSCTSSEVLQKSSALFKILPESRVLALTNNGREATLCEMRPTHREIGPMSPDTLIEIIRHSAAHDSAEMTKEDD